jgi:predicted phosphodiesterase
MKTAKYKGEHEYLYVMGDTHIGHPNTNMKLLQKHIDLIRKTKAPWVHIGDWVDAISSDDRRFNIEDHRVSVVEAYLDMEELFNPIVPSCVAVLRGNHGSKWSKQEGDMIKVIARRWGVPYLGYCGFVLFFVGNKSYKIWLHHGAGGGRKRGAKTIRLNEWAQFIEADLYLQGHTHTYVGFNDQKVTSRGKKVRWYGNVPGYIDSYTGHDNYVEELGLNPQCVGMLRVEMNPIKILPVIE